MGVVAPVIVEEMNEWTAIGGGNSGIVGDPSHSYGFHLAAQELSPTDYSRWRDPNGSAGPYVDWSYACAGDFSHGYDPGLMEMHRLVLQRLMNGELQMICEFIGKPFADQPVLYWARWNGDQTLQRYTGTGHDSWSHISWYRSRVDQRAYLWTPGPVSPTRKRSDMRPFLLIQPTNGAGIALAWPSDVAKGWVFCDIMPPGVGISAAAVFDAYLALGCIDARGWEIPSFDGYTALRDIPEASVELGDVNVNVGAFDLSLTGKATPKP